ncbi:hypothetical protein HPP92_026348 [Vanilla planifolia]|uniref:BTB domain-containing protein n=1 Tax=Vanilla planifolia TaxID=51239 RepID=A0A835PH68_VANPL|nr:hypothetical protein HPP92_026348 [Vanilla planifolia]
MGQDGMQDIYSASLVCLAFPVTLVKARCPRLMPSKQAFMENNNPDSRFFHGNSLHELNSMMEMKMSERVDMFSLMKILEFVYTGFILIEEDMVRPLRSLAKRCGLSSLSHMLHRKSPPWGAPVPAIDLGHVLEPMEELFWNVTLESNKVSGDDWTCSTCVRTEPHAHAHKIVLWSNCEYLRALFHSGMKDSHLDVVKVPVSYIALTKLVKWLYTGKLPRISIDCRWNNMATIQQMGELQPYVELCFLGEFWFMDEIKEDSLNMVLSCLEHNPKLSMEIVSFAADHRQWSIVQAAVSNVAHLYPRMHDSGELERLGEVSDLLRTKYVELSQKNFLMA